MSTPIKSMLQVFATLSISKLMTVVASLVLAFNLTKLEYGTYTLLVAIAGGITPLIALNCSVGVMRESSLAKTRKESHAVLSEYFYYLYRYSVVIVGALVLTACVLLQNHTELVNGIVFCAVAAVFMSFVKALQVHLRFIADFKKFGLLEIGRSFFLLVICATLFSLSEIILSLIIFYLGVIFLALFFWRNNSVSRVDKKRLKTIVLVSLPTIIAAYSAYLTNMSDRLLIEYYIGREALAEYSFSYNAGMVVLLIVDSIFIVVQPKLLRICNQNKSRSFRIITQLNGGALVLAVIVFIFFQQARLLIATYLPEAYKNSVDIIPFIAVAFVVRFLYQVSNVFHIALGNTGFIAKITLIAGIVNVILNVLFLEAYGIKFAAYSTIFSFALITVQSYLKVCFVYRRL